MLYKLSFVAAIFLGSALTAAGAQEVVDDETVFEQETELYTKCIEAAQTNPQVALETALTWRDTGGGLPARHCAAVAYTNLGQYLNAALEFETLADEMRRGVGWHFKNTPTPSQKGLLPDVYAQGGNAWLLAGDAVKAYEFFTLGLAEATPGSKTSIDLLIDRSLASAQMGEFEKALDDLLEVEGKVKPSPEIYILKASAYRSLEEYDKARIEIKKAFQLDPTNREGYLEMGNLLRETGDNGGARENWLAYLRLYPDGPAADAVRKNLENMDLNPDGEN